MADLIKKIKIKKQDGTFTDYIPIGAEAKNIETEDGDSVQLKLNKKPYYYNTVADMKIDSKLKAGDIVITLGYYEINDGGKAIYKISNIESETTYQEILNNGLYASLIIENNKINVLQVGITSNENINYTSKIQSLINMASTLNLLIEFNPVTYYISALNIKCDIEGNNCTFKTGYFSTSNVVALRYGKNNITCKNFTVDSEQFGSTANLRTDIRNNDNITLINVKMINFIHSGNNAWGLLITNAHNIKLIDCEGEDCSQSTIAIVENTSVYLDKCIIESINVEPNSADYLVDVNINDCVIDLLDIKGNSRISMYITCNVSNSYIKRFIPRTCVVQVSNTRTDDFTQLASYASGSVRGNIENIFNLGLELNVNPFFKDLLTETGFDRTKGYSYGSSPTSYLNVFKYEDIPGISNVFTINYNKRAYGYVQIGTDYIPIQANKYYMIKVKDIITSDESNSNVGQLIRTHFYKYENDEYTEIENKVFMSGCVKKNENTGIQDEYVVVKAPENATHLQVRLGHSGGNSSATTYLIEMNIKEINFNMLNI